MLVHQIDVFWIQQTATGTSVGVKRVNLALVIASSSYDTSKLYLDLAFLGCVFVLSTFWQEMFHYYSIFCDL